MSQRALEALKRVIDPELRAPITELGMVGTLDETKDSIRAQIKLTIVGCPASQAIERDVRVALESEYKSVEVVMTVMSPEEREELKSKLRAGKPLRHNPFADKDNLTNVIFVGSGKGGVGKSSITANLAVALSKLGFKVGLLDADIFGYSIPGQLGITTKPTKVDELMLPPIAFGVKVISIGFFVEDNKPVAWRGPMLHRAVEQFLTDVYWGDLDFLLVDLPPGTGDVAISLGQLIPKAKSLVVTTPQPAAASVAERSGAIGTQTGQEILGVIENMSYLETETGRVELFGSGGGEIVADRLSSLTGKKVEVLGQIPMSQSLRIGSDTGVPIVEQNPKDSASIVLLAIAKLISETPRNLNGKSLGLKPR